jgi:hypothetical protein
MLPMTSPEERTKPRVTDAPLKIWLNYGDLARDCTHRDCTYEEDVTWCEDNVSDSDVLYVRADVAEAQLLAAQADAARYRWLAPRLLAADFAWGDPPIPVIVFEWPANVGVGGNCDMNIDAALSTSETKP